MISRLLQIIGLFCRIYSLLQGSFAKETYNCRSLITVATPYLTVLDEFELPSRCYILQHTRLQHTNIREAFYFVWRSWGCRVYDVSSTHCNTLRRTTTHCDALQDTATHCNTLQHTTTTRQSNTLQYRLPPMRILNTLQHTATRCNTLQHTATHCNTLQHTTTHCNTLHHSATRCNADSHRRGFLTHCNTLQHMATQCNIVQHTAIHLNTLQHRATHCNADSR